MWAIHVPTGMARGAGSRAGGGRLAVGSPQVDPSAVVGVGWTMWAPAGTTGVAPDADGRTPGTAAQADVTTATAASTTDSSTVDQREAVVEGVRDIADYRYSASRSRTPNTASAAASSDKSSTPHRRIPTSAAAPVMDRSKDCWE